MNCEHPRTFRIYGHSRDMNSWTTPDGTEGDGYAPYIMGLCGGDDIDVEVCIDCSKVLGLASATEILKVLEDD
jgi:hypothetical protein